MVPGTDLPIGVANFPDSVGSARGCGLGDMLCQVGRAKLGPHRQGEGEHSTRLETRTKESNVDASRRGVNP